jgi:phage terminase small subunit
VSADNLYELGPAMLALNDAQRRFVFAMASNPFGTQKEWAIAAGYSDVKDGAKVRAHELLHNPKIERAVREYAKFHLGTFGPLLASAVMLRVARNPRHPQHLRAAEMIANRVGLHETTQHVVSVEHTDRTGAAMVEKIKRLAEKHGLNAASLIGENVIEGEAVAIEDKRDEGFVEGVAQDSVRPSQHDRDPGNREGVVSQAGAPDGGPSGDEE